MYFIQWKFINTDIWITWDNTTYDFVRKFCVYLHFTPLFSNIFVHDSYTVRRHFENYSHWAAIGYHLRVNQSDCKDC